MAGTDTSEGQAVWQPGGAEDSCLREDNRHLRLAYDEEERRPPSLSPSNAVITTMIILLLLLLLLIIIITLKDAI